jgi:hypothetical protein
MTKQQKALVKRMVKSAIRTESEIKYFPFGFVPFAQTNAGFVTPITQVVQGIGHNQRLGDRIRPVAFSIRFSIIASENTIFGAADRWDPVRVIIFRWFDDSTPALPVTNDILIAGTSGDRTLAPYNRSESPRYKILYDRTFTLNSTPVWNGANVIFELGPGSTTSEVVVLKGKKVTPIMEFENGAVTGSNQLFLLTVTSSGFTPHPFLGMDSELGFTDA